MKSIQFNIQKFARTLFVFATMILFTTSCQEEKVINENPPPQQVVEPGSAMYDLLLNSARNNGSVDNIIDNTSCASIELPVTIIVNGIEITINTLDDLQLIIDLYEQNQGDDTLEIIFPITIILSDYSTLVIESQDELDAFIASCTEEDDDCVDFVFPISFTIFNTEFELIETVVINTSEELYIFLQTIAIEPGNIVSLNFPVTLIYGNGTTIEVATNQELVAALEAGPDNCEIIIDPENPCPALNIETYLQECFWYPSQYDGDTENPYKYYHFTFLENAGLEMTTSNSFAIDAVWDVYEENAETFLQLNSNLPLFDPFRGVWKVISCSEIEIVVENEAGVQLIFTRDCEIDLADCFGSGEGICDPDNDGFVSVNFGEISNQANCNDTLEYSITFHETYEDANQFINPLPSPYQTTVPNSQTFYYAVYELNTNQVKYVSSYQIDAEDCGACENPGLLTNDLVLYMPFSGEIKDLISGQTHSNNGAFFTQDRDGNNCAIGFDETSDNIFIQTASENMIMDGDDFSVSLWFKMQNNEAGDYEVMFSTTFDTNQGIQLSVFDLNTPLFVAHDPEISLWDNDWNQEVDVQWENTDWHHLVITYTNGVGKLYRDGVLRNEDTSNTINPGFGIGYILNAEGFRGHLDDLRVYKRGLSIDEILVLFNDDADCYTCLD